MTTQIYTTLFDNNIQTKWSLSEQQLKHAEQIRSSFNYALASSVLAASSAPALR